MSDSFVVYLLTTCALDQHGSMRRYADIVERGLKAYGPKLNIRRIDLAPRKEMLSACPDVLKNRLHHALISSAGRRASHTMADGVIHLLDGSYSYLLNMLPCRRSVVTCHDLIPLRQCLGLLGSRPSWPARYLIRKSCKGLAKAERVVTECGSVLRDVSALVGVDSKRISVNALPLDDTWHESSGPEETRRHLLHVGNAAFYKNREAVLRIFSKVAEKWPGRLILAGAPADDALRSLAVSLGVDGRVDFISHPLDEELRRLYQTAALLIFPSLIEGYGWPPMEAVACGCPVVASDVGGIKEVLGQDGGMWFDPADESGMAAACLEVLINPEKAAALIASGQQSLNKLSLQRMSFSLIDVYKKVRVCA